MDGTGLYYYGARFYDPTLGRFINMDPAKDGNNWWVYCANNPLRYVDPDGKNAEALLLATQWGYLSLDPFTTVIALVGTIGYIAYDIATEGPITQSVQSMINSLLSSDLARKVQPYNSPLNTANLDLTLKWKQKFPELISVLTDQSEFSIRYVQQAKVCTLM